MFRTRRVLEIFTLAVVFSMLLPQEWVNQMRVAGAPPGALALVPLSVVAILRLAKVPGAVTPSLIAGVVALTITSAWGYFRGNVGEYTLKFFVADMFCLVALLTGSSIASLLGPHATAQLVRKAALVASIAIILTYIGLFTGVIILDFDIGGRIVTQSIFGAAGFLIILLPWVSGPAEASSTGGAAMSLLPFTTAMAAALLSATRSLVIEIAAAVVLWMIARRRRLGGVFLLRATFAGIVLALVAFGVLRLSDTTIVERISTTNIEEEARLDEVRIFWQAISGDLLSGQGMGSRFESNIIVADSPLASAPHLGILAFLMKGGIVMFLAYAVLPLLVAVMVLSFRPHCENQTAAAGAVLIYLISASLSGGWTPLSLLAYGMALGTMAAKTSRVSASRLRPSVGARPVNPDRRIPVDTAR